MHVCVWGGVWQAVLYSPSWLSSGYILHQAGTLFLGVLAHAKPPQSLDPKRWYASISTLKILG